MQIPKEIQRKLEQATRGGRNGRTGLVRETLSSEKKERLIQEMKKAACILNSDPEEVREGRELAEMGLQEWVEAIEAEERAAGGDPDEIWWE